MVGISLAGQNLIRKDEVSHAGGQCGMRKAAKRHDRRIRRRQQRLESMDSLATVAAHLMCEVCRLRQLEVAPKIEALTCGRCRNGACCEYDTPQTAAKVSIATLAAWRTSRRTKPTGTGEQVVGQMTAEHELNWCQHGQNRLARLTVLTTRQFHPQCPSRVALSRVISQGDEHPFRRLFGSKRVLI